MSGDLILVKEIRSGSFGRSITFDKPIDADKIDTSYENGMLTIAVPYSEAGKPKKISVKKEEPRNWLKLALDNHNQC